jgi:hypothetical protein
MSANGNQQLRGKNSQNAPNFMKRERKVDAGTRVKVIFYGL